MSKFNDFNIGDRVSGILYNKRYNGIVFSFREEVLPYYMDIRYDKLDYIVYYKENELEKYDIKLPSHFYSIENYINYV